MTHSFSDTSSSDSHDEGASASYRITHQRGPVSRQVRAAAIAWGGEKAWEALLDSVSPECRSR
ncbi:MAG: hypothetical protein Q8O00_02845, partial [Holophaga sp.]|nr:hypothetical protein [Holophaga sp.]